MKQHWQQWAAGRESRAATYFGVLFGTAIITILAIRGFLAITGYPQLGGESLHIAHMLWGGLFMLAAIITLLYVHGHRAKVVGAFLGGVGFGFFIDELGKFITNNNDYFYQPAAMLIYIIFLLLWALFSWLDNYVPTTSRQQFVDVLTRLRDASVHGMTEQDEQYAKQQLSRLGIAKKEQKALLAYVSTFAPTYRPHSYTQTTKQFGEKLRKVRRVVLKSRFTPIIVYATITVSAASTAVVLLLALLNNQNIFDIYPAVPILVEVGLMVASVVSIGCVAVGFWYSKRNWHNTLVWYKLSLLVNVFATQVFLFYINQFTAVFGLAFSLLLLYVLTILEKKKKKK